MSEYRVQWTGSRDWKDPMLVESLMTRVSLAAIYRGTTLHVAHGFAKGLDSMVDRAAWDHRAKISTWLPDWERYGKRAGILRNETMVDEFEPHIGIGLNWNNSAGTRHAVTHMKKKGIPVLSIEYTGDPEGKYFPF